MRWGNERTWLFFVSLNKRGRCVCARVHVCERGVIRMDEKSGLTWGGRGGKGEIQLKSHLVGQSRG